MKSHQLFICDMNLSVLLKTNFHIIQCEDVGGCRVEGPAVCCTVQVVPAAVGAADAWVQQEKLLAQALVPHRARALV